MKNKHFLFMLILSLLVFSVCLASCGKSNSVSNNKDGLSAYDIYKKYHPKYTKSEEEWINDVVTGRFNETEEINHTYGFDFKLKQDDTYRLDFYNGIENDVVIPENYNGKSVTSIGDYAFSNCRGLRRITIPNSITSIGDYAFCGCNNMARIIIPSNVTSIGRGAFAYCNGITSITMPYVPTHIGDIFDDTNEIPSSLKEIIITGGTSIGDNAFSGCSGLTSVTIPNSVTSIGNAAFA